MGTAPLPDHAAPLRLRDVPSCRRWLETLPRTDIPRAQAELASTLAALSSETALSALERLRILETMKETFLVVQSAAAHGYLGRPLPLDENEARSWTDTLAAWRVLQTNYELCLQAHRDNDPAIAPCAALVALRCLQCVTWRMLDHYRAHREPAPALWRELNAFYALAEEQGHAQSRVHDMFSQRDSDPSCAEVYVQALLMQLANPYALSAQQQAMARRWLEQWAALVTVGRNPAPHGPIPLLAVDLAGSSGASVATGAATPTLRHLRLEPLARTLLQTLALLKQGQSPAQLGLGGNGRQPASDNLLMLLYVQWCRAGTGRTEERMRANDCATVSAGIAGAHHDSSTAAPCGEPAEQVDATRSQRRAVETWVILNHSPLGFLCMQRHPGSRMRVNSNQLFAVWREGETKPRLGVAQWVRIDDAGKLLCGVKLFPGIPEAVAARPSNFIVAGGDSYERALLLPEVQLPATPATIVLPAGWFQSGRFVEIFTDRKRVARLLNLLERGSDFDRGTIAFV